MKSQLGLIALFAIILSVSVSAGIDCPFTSGKVIEYCNVDITPMERLYNEEVMINVSLIYQREAVPIDTNTKFEIWFYNSSNEVEIVKFRTDKTGIIRYTPTIVGYHLIKVCEKSILIYINTTCGDGVCAGEEGRDTCAIDCGDCGDGICDSNEDINCRDCAVCGDGACTAGETRKSCLIDCVFCGDDVCDYLENRTSCPLDCSSGACDGVCDGEADDVCDPDCEPEDDPDCEIPEPIVNETGEVAVVEGDSDYDDIVMMFMIIVTCLIAGAIFLTVIKIRKNNEPLDKKTPEKGKTKKPRKKKKKTKKKPVPSGKQ